jgi:hypothetical protein
MVKKRSKMKNRPKRVFYLYSVENAVFDQLLPTKKEPLYEKSIKKIILNLRNFLKIYNFLSKFMTFWQKNEFFSCF